MKKRTGDALKLLISIAIAAIILYYTLKSVDVRAILGKLSSIDYRWVVFSMTISIFAHYFRALRWNILLKPLGYKPDNWRTTLSVLVGYMANLGLPRIGEVIRCGVLNRTDNVPVTSSFGTVVADRILDLLVLILLILIALVTDFGRYFKFLTDLVFNNDSFELKPWQFGLLIGLFFLGLVAAYLIYQLTPISKKFGKIGQMVMDGLFSFSRIDSKGMFLLSTMAIWGIYFIMSYVIVFSIDETAHLGLSAGLAIIIAGGLGMSMPVQGGIGTYHLFVSSILVLFGIGKETGLALALLLHSSQILAVVVLGSTALIVSLIIKPKDSSIENSVVSEKNL